MWRDDRATSYQPNLTQDSDGTARPAWVQSAAGWHDLLQAAGTLAPKVEGIEEDAQFATVRVVRASQPHECNLEAIWEGFLCREEKKTRDGEKIGQRNSPPPTTTMPSARCLMEEASAIDVSVHRASTEPSKEATTADSPQTSQLCREGMPLRSTRLCEGNAERGSRCLLEEHQSRAVIKSRAVNGMGGML